MRQKQERAKKEMPWRRWILPPICVAGSMGLYLLLTVVGPSEEPVSKDGMIVREGYGGGEQEYQIMVEGLEDQEIPVTVHVGPRRYTKEEADRIFYEIMDEIEEQIRAENPSLMEITSDLKLPSRLDHAGIRLRWQSSDPDLLSSAGVIKKVVTTKQPVTLYVELTDGEYRAEFELPLRLVPPVRSPEEERLEAFQQSLRALEEEQKQQEYMKLPETYEGRALRYRVPKRNEYIALPLLGILLALLLIAREQTGEKEREKKRELELLLDYAELVSKLMVLIGAGMTIRTAWERMVKDYEAGLTDGRQKERAAYEEMRQTYYQLSNGTPEGTAYREFGRRCKLQPYLKLSSLLEQNRRAGTKNLRSILQMEMADAFELRKNLARRMGEEAGTKLLVPLFLMLGIVMVMIMVPAMMTMG